MAGSATDLLIRLLVDDADLDKVDQSKDRFEAWGTTLDKASRGAAIGLTALTGVAVLSGAAAADAEQAIGAVDAVYGAYADKVHGYAEQAAQSVSLSETEYSNMAAIIGSQFKNMGIPMDEVAVKTDEMIGLGADLAATFGGTTADAVNALSSLFRGETDPIEQFGVSIKEADINAQLATMGLTGLEGEAAKTARTQAILALLTKQTADAQGQHARESDTASGAMGQMQAQIGNASAALGTALLPLIAEGSGMLGEFATWVSENTSLVGGLAIGAGVLAGAILLANGAYKAYALVSGVVTAVQAASTGGWIANTGAMIANKATSVAIMALYVKDFVIGMARTAAGLAVSTGAWIANTAAVGVARGMALASAVATGIQTAAQWANNAAWLASPVTWIILAIIVAIGLLVAAAIWLFNNWDSVTRFIGEAWANVAAWFQQVGANIASWWTGLWTGIGQFVASAWQNWIVAPIRGAWMWVQSALQAGLAFIDAAWRGTWTGLGNIVKGVWNGVLGWIEGGVNGAIDLINGMIRGVNDIGGVIGIELALIPKVRLPRLATGGVTTGPMMAIIGDNPGGREYVEPVDQVAERLERVALAAAAGASPRSSGSSRMHPDDIRDLARAIGETVYPLIMKGAQKTVASALGG